MTFTLHPPHPGEAPEGYGKRGAQQLDSAAERIGGVVQGPHAGTRGPQGGDSRSQRGGQPTAVQEAQGIIIIIIIAIIIISIVSIVIIIIFMIMKTI